MLRIFYTKKWARPPRERGMPFRIGSRFFFLVWRVGPFAVCREFIFGGSSNA